MPKLNKYAIVVTTVTETVYEIEASNPTNAGIIFATTKPQPTSTREVKRTASSARKL